jgi:hypothetical protein
MADKFLGVLARIWFSAKCKRIAKIFDALKRKKDWYGFFDSKMHEITKQNDNVQKIQKM